MSNRTDLTKVQVLAGLWSDWTQETMFDQNLTPEVSQNCMCSQKMLFPRTFLFFY